MTCRRLRPRIEFLPPEKEKKDKNHPLRDVIEDYEDRHKKFDDWKKAQVAAAIKKEQENSQQKAKSFFNFLIWAHVLFIVEFTIAKLVFGL